MTDAPTTPPAPTPRPGITPDPVTLAEIELALLGIGPSTTSVTLPAELADDAAAAGGLVITDREGAPVAILAAPAITTAPGPDTCTGIIEPLPGAGEDDRPLGPYASLRVPPRAARFDGWAAVVGHDPVDAHSLAAAGEEQPVLLVVLEGPRARPGPRAAVVARAALDLRHQLRQAGRTAEVVLLPAPQYGDERDPKLAAIVAEAYGAELIQPDRRPDLAALRAGLDGQASLPTADWPQPSLEAWQHWRPARAERGLVMLFTGLSGSGKSTVARAVTDRLEEDVRRTITLLDGDVVRRNLSAGLGFSRADRDRNVERIGYVAAEIARHGGIAVCAPIAPFAATRARVRAMAEEHGDFLLVHVATPLEECERRDRKGLYARARAGEIPDFTGISSPYEEPDDADLVLDTSRISIAEARDVVLELLSSGGWITGRDGMSADLGRRP